jgi:dienelactone hydrolase
VASFHGGLTDFKASEMMKNTKVLICNGAADAFVPQADIDNFKSEMDKYGITYEFKNYEGATHAFTNKYSTEAGKKFNMPIAYNEAADKASWQDMISFFAKYFPAK